MRRSPRPSQNKSMRGEQEYAVEEFCRILGARECEIGDAFRVNGGVNNAVYQINSASGKYILKKFPLTPTFNGVSRLKRELEFIHYANKYAPGKSSSLVGYDIKERMVILNYIEGSDYSSSTQVSPSDVQEAELFLCSLNRRGRSNQEEYRLVAVEAYLSISEHIDNIEGRLERLKQVKGIEGSVEIAKTLRALQDRGLEVTTKARSLLGTKGIRDRIESRDLIVSPGDFGFHNGKKTKDGIVFYDFEFSGKDDPAKVVIDFALQPQVRAPRSIDIGRLGSEGIVNRDLVASRITVLGPLMALKWACIALSIFDRDRLGRMKTLMTDQMIYDLREERLFVANEMLDVQICRDWSTL